MIPESREFMISTWTNPNKGKYISFAIFSGRPTFDNQETFFSRVW